MGELYKFPVSKRENKEQTKTEQVEEIDFSRQSERNAISETLLKERYDFLLNLKRNNQSLKHSEAYKSAYDLLVKSSRVGIANMINETPEIIINKKPAYFIAAFDILCL